jgi:hypothetical protein
VVSMGRRNTWLEPYWIENKKLKAPAGQITQKAILTRF